MNVTITGPNAHGGGFHVHLTGCRDLSRRPYRDIAPLDERYEEDHECRQTIVEGVYADHEGPWEHYESEFRFFPCLAGLPRTLCPECGDSFGSRYHEVACDPAGNQEDRMPADFAGVVLDKLCTKCGQPVADPVLVGPELCDGCAETWNEGATDDDDDAEPSFWFAEGFSVTGHGTAPLATPEELSPADLLDYVRGIHAGIVDEDIPPTAATAPDGRISDSAALDQLHALMSGTEWSAETLEGVAEVVAATGRVIAEPSHSLDCPAAHLPDADCTCGRG